MVRTIMTVPKSNTHAKEDQCCRRAGAGYRIESDATHDHGDGKGEGQDDARHQHRRRLLHG